MSDLVGPRATLKDEEKLFASLINLPVAQFVFNGTVSNVSAADISTYVMYNNRPLALLTMSPVLAKAYAAELLIMVERYETAIGVTLPDYTDLAMKLRDQQ